MYTNSNETTAPHSISSLLNKDSFYSQSLPTPITPKSSPKSSPSIVSSALPSDEEQSKIQKTAGGRILSSGAPHFGSFTVRSAGNIKTPPGTPPSKSSTGRIQLTKSFRCDQCSQTFSRLNNLKSHRTTHTSERPYQCDQCHQDFRRQHDLKRHQKLHTGERPFKCNTCHRSFARLDALNRHQRVEGGTACHNNQPTATAKNSTLPSTNHRPHIPQLNIPDPATKPPLSFIPSALSSENNGNNNNNLLILPWSPSSRTLPLPASSSPSPKQKPSLLPSPSSPSSPSYSSPPPKSSFILLPSPSYSASSSMTASTIDNYHTTMPRSSTPSSMDSSFSNSNADELAFWKSEYDQIKTSMRALQEKTQWQEQEIMTLKTTCHDLRVENKVLTSLILTKKTNQPSM